MSYVNRAGQTVKVGSRVAYRSYHHTLHVGKVISFTDAGNPRIELEGRTEEWVRDRYRRNVEFMKRDSANIWARRPYRHYRHKDDGYLITREQYQELPQNTWPQNKGPRNDYTPDPGQLDSHWIEFTKPTILTVVNRNYVVVIERESGQADSIED